MAKKAATTAGAKKPKAGSIIWDGGKRGAGKLRVRATRLGYYGEERKRVGDVFDLASEKHFSATWMERVDGKTAKKTTTGKQALAEQMGDASRKAAKSAENPLGD